MWSCGTFALNPPSLWLAQNEVKRAYDASDAELQLGEEGYRTEEDFRAFVRHPVPGIAAAPVGPASVAYEEDLVRWRRPSCRVRPRA